MVGIWLSVMALIATVSIMTGFLRESREMIRGTTSDLILSPRTYGRVGALTTPPTYDMVAAALDGIEGIVATCPHLLRPALISVEGKLPDIARMTPDDPGVIKCIGIDLELEKQATRFADYLRDPTHPEDRVDDPSQPFAWVGPAKSKLPVVLLGEGLMERHGISKGDEINLVTLPDDVTAERAPIRSQTFHVGGAVHTGHFLRDREAIFMERSAARDFAKSAQDATEICVLAEDGVDLDDLALRTNERMITSGLDVTVETWQQRNSMFLNSVKNQRSILAFLLFFFVVVACFNVFATLTILVSDKTRDIGVLGAMGAAGKGIAGLFVSCAMVMTFFGATAGCISGVILANNINLVHEGLESLLGVRIFRKDIYWFDQVPAEVQGWFVGLVFAATMLIAVLCALLPALRAARMDPVRALRYE